MSGHLKQVRSYGVALIAYVVLNAAIWHLFTQQFSDSTHYVGGLARLSYLAQYAEPRLTRNTFEKRRIVFDEWSGEAIDLVTIGDSFSAGGVVETTTTTRIGLQPSMKSMSSTFPSCQRLSRISRPPTS